MDPLRDGVGAGPNSIIYNGVNTGTKIKFRNQGLPGKHGQEPNRGKNQTQPPG